jgi:hypothetical protein
MMVVLALRADPIRVYQRALRQFTVEEITEAFAATQGRAMPSQVRELLMARPDLRMGFLRLLPISPRPIRIQRWSARRVGLWALVGVLLGLVVPTIVTGVTVDEAGKTPLYITNLACTDLEPLWLEAQSLPSASLVPCIRSLPAGWSVAGVDVNNGRSVLTLNHDRAGGAAMVVRLGASCDMGRATRVPSNQPGVRRFMRIERLRSRFAATRFDVFAGGCVSTRMTAPAEYQADLTAGVPRILGFTSRQTLQQALERRSNGRLHLEPVGEG